MTVKEEPRQSMAPALTAKTKRRPVWLNASLFGIAAALALLAYALLPESMGEAARRMASIFVLAVGLWVTEAVPLFATSMLVIVAEAWLLAVPEDLNVDISSEQVFAAFGNPIIFLFLGGFILAKAVQKQNIDVQMAALLMRPFGTRPAGVLAGVMVITAIFSMWMSNTATTAMMIVLVQPLALQVPESDRFRKALILAVPFAANIGGIGTPIGTPPNAIALAALRERGLEVNFFQWMAFGVPLLVGTMLVLWLFLLIVYRPESQQLAVEVKKEFRLTRNALTVYICFFVTVALWLTQPFHGVPNAVVAVVPAAALTATRVIDRKDFNSLEWDILLLMAGGMALGAGITMTELDQWIVSAFPSDQLGYFMLVALSCLLVVGLGTVMSHTVAASIALPIGISVAAQSALPQEIQVLAVMVAVASSFAVALPISTPPNAIAYGSGMVETRDIMSVGILTSIAGTLLVVFTGPYVVSHFLAWLS